MCGIPNRVSVSRTTQAQNKHTSKICIMYWLANVPRTAYSTQKMRLAYVMNAERMPCSRYIFLMIQCSSMPLYGAVRGRNMLNYLTRCIPPAAKGSKKWIDLRWDDVCWDGTANHKLFFVPFVGRNFQMEFILIMVQTFRNRCCPYPAPCAADAPHTSYI